MDNKIHFSSIAQIEFEESTIWYEEQVPGLGEQFAEEIYRAAGAISENPEAYPKKRAQIREFVVDRFPFLIVYEYLVADHCINILHIFHTSRNPRLKYKKSKEGFKK